MIAKEIAACRLCGSRDFDDILDLGAFALCGRFPAAGEPDPPRAPLHLLFCHSCGLVQLRHNFDLDELFRYDYGYRSGINQTMRSHLAGIADSAASLAELRKGDVVLDVGSNDATLLKSYPAIGLQRIGLDPTVDTFREFYPDDILAISNYFSAAALADILPGAKAKVITSIAMFYDLPDPHAFVRDIARSLEPEGLWLFEQSYLPAMIRSNSVDTICHEHLEYYALSQVVRLLAEHSLRVFDVLHNDSNGGSFRVYACHDDARYRTDPRVEATLARERAEGYLSPAPLVAFRTAALSARQHLVNLLDRQRDQGRSVYAYGASTKGNSLLQFCGLTREAILAAADRNPAKWGRRTPATNIPIESEAAIRGRRPDFFLVLPWHFRKEFLARENDFLAGGGRFIFPLPELSIVEASDRREPVR